MASLVLALMRDLLFRLRPCAISITNNTGSLCSLAALNENATNNEMQSATRVAYGCIIMTTIVKTVGSWSGLRSPPPSPLVAILAASAGD